MKFVVSAQQDGRVLRNLLQTQYKFSRRLLRQLVQTNGVSKNDRPVYLTERLHKGDIINITLPKEESNVLPVPENLDIRYEDDEILVLNKPPGILSHPTAWERDQSLLSGLLFYLAETGLVPHCVHRLDRDTSGLVMFAKNAHSHHLFDIALQSNLMHRSYTALVHLPERAGAEAYEWQTVLFPIAGDSNQPSRRIISMDGQPAVTHYRLLYQQNHVGLAQLSLETGRTHQIRLHMAAVGMPVIGDGHYNWNYAMIPSGPGQQKITEDFEQLSKEISRQALHAYKLEWTHPVSGKTTVALTPPPPDFRSVLSSHGLSDAAWNDLWQELCTSSFASKAEL